MTARTARGLAGVSLYSRPMSGFSTLSLPTLSKIKADAVELPAASLVVEVPGQEAVSYPLEVGGLVIGSGDASDVVVKDSGVSRQHCRIAVEARGIVVSDLGSKNGTFIAGVPILEALLALSTPVRIGNTTFQLRPEASPRVVPLSPSASFGQAVGASVVMRALFSQLERISKTDETVLLLGESGTGKEILARAVHEHSPRREGPYVVFDCSAVASNLIEAELFGHVRGAFTGADRDRDGVFVQANGGTVFLDEIGELPLDLQPKLLRAIEARQVKPVGTNTWRSVDVRLIAATHRNLRQRVVSEEFREDLYYRLAVFQVPIPPLRERPEDIPILVEKFLSEISPPVRLESIPPNVLAMLNRHRWPGNVRELHNVVTRIALLPQLSDDLLDPITSSTTSDGTFEPLLRLPLRDAREAVVETFERRYLIAQLQKQGGNVTQTAEVVGVSRQFLHRLLERHGLSAADFR